MIYILQFSGPLGNERHQAQYYLGWCPDDGLQSRLYEHEHGWGAAITRAAVKRGLSLAVVATLPGDRKRERELKRQKNTPRLVCQLLAQGAARKGHCQGLAQNAGEVR